MVVVISPLVISKTKQDKTDSCCGTQYQEVGIADFVAIFRSFTVAPLSSCLCFKDKMCILFELASYNNSCKQARLLS